MDSILKTEEIAIGYAQSKKRTHILATDLSLSLTRGELTCLVGPNGAGKSTLLRTLAGIHPPLSGKVLFHNIDTLKDGWTNIQQMNLRTRAKHISLVLTEPIQFGNLTSFDLAALGRYPHTDWSGRITEEDEAAVLSALKSVGALNLATRNLRELSDGERQKVIIARALAQAADLIILDEPTAFLDIPHRLEMLHTLKVIAHTTQKAILLSTHDLDLALRNADILWCFPAGGPLYLGAPEDAVLSGMLEKTFYPLQDTPSRPAEAQTTVFDLRSGSFIFAAHADDELHPGTEIHLLGNGIQTDWTQRALQRTGFRVSRRPSKNRNGTSYQVEVLNGNGQYRWRVSSASENVQEYSSLYALVDHFRIHP